MTAITLGGSPGQAWTYQYDAEGRLTTACKASSRTGTPARLDMTYDAQGHRIRLVETTAGGSPTITTTDFSYEGDRVVREVSVTGATTITRTFTTDEAGAIIKVTEAETGDATDETYLVTYNGHGDAISLAEIDPTSGVLTTANRMTYSTWGTPDVTTQNGYANLGFRYLYVGRFDVQWDDFAGAGLLYMHARHYHPEFGRFLQPDPSAAEANLYAYAENSPITKADPSGEEGHPVEWLACILKGFDCPVIIQWSQWAAGVAQARYTSRELNGDRIGDGFRHCCWAAGLSWRLSATTSKLTTDTHEAWGAGQSSIDYWNNTVGREFGTGLRKVLVRKDSNDAEARRRIMSACKLRLDRDLIRYKYPYMKPLRYLK